MGLTGLQLVSYPFHQALGSLKCVFSLAVVLCLLVSLLGLVVFVVFSKIYMFLGGDSHCPTHAAILAPGREALSLKKTFSVYFSFQCIVLPLHNFGIYGLYHIFDTNMLPDRYSNA